MCALTRTWAAERTGRASEIPAVSHRENVQEDATAREPRTSQAIMERSKPKDNDPLPSKKRKTMQQPKPGNPPKDEAASINSSISKTSLPDWYSRVDRKKIREAIDNCKDNPRGDLARTFEGLREAIHDAEFGKVDEVVLRNTRLLEKNVGLPLIFDNNKIGYPFDIVADSQELGSKWCRRVLGPDLMGGIHSAKEWEEVGQPTLAV